MINSKWDPEFKNDSSELVPLNYSLKDRNGHDIGYGIKLTFSDKISEFKEINKFLVSTSIFVNQYYITATDA
ncbi:MAG: hypothetical protein LBF12_07700 [Christensenellaceae bacterium]|jgi:hypothetical protein|nr:hypothetical protein [Christensenellaceae bacterium]